MSALPSLSKEIAFLNSLDICKSLNDRTLETMIKDFEEIFWKPGEVLFREGDSSGALYVVIQGGLLIEKGLSFQQTDKCPRPNQNVILQII